MSRGARIELQGWMLVIVRLRKTEDKWGKGLDEFRQLKTRYRYMQNAANWPRSRQVRRDASRVSPEAAAFRDCLHGSADKRGKHGFTFLLH